MREPLPPTVVSHAARRYAHRQQHVARGLGVVALIGMVAPLCLALGGERSFATLLASQFACFLVVSVPLLLVRSWATTKKAIALRVAHAAENDPTLMWWNEKGTLRAHTAERPHGELALRVHLTAADRAAQLPAARARATTPG